MAEQVPGSGGVRQDDSETGISPVVRAVVWSLLVLGIVVAIIAVMLPSDLLSSLRSEYRMFGRPLNWLEGFSGRFDLTHVILFAWIGLLWTLLARKTPWWRFALPLLALAAGTEMLQFLAPGRRPLLGDLYDDLIGIAIGVALAMPLRWLLVRRPDKPSA